MQEEYKPHPEEVWMDAAYRWEVQKNTERALQNNCGFFLERLQLTEQARRLCNIPVDNPVLSSSDRWNYRQVIRASNAAVKANEQKCGKAWDDIRYKVIARLPPLLGPPAKCRTRSTYVLSRPWWYPTRRAKREPKNPRKRSLRRRFAWARALGRLRCSF